MHPHLFFGKLLCPQAERMDERTERIYGEFQKSKQDDADKEKNNKFVLTY